jgi:hypothetical protein
VNCAIAVVAVKLVGGGGAGGGVPRPEAAVDEEQIREAVVVEIEKRDAAAHGFGQEFVAVSAVGMDEARCRRRR